MDTTPKRENSIFTPPRRQLNLTHTNVARNGLINDSPVSNYSPSTSTVSTPLRFNKGWSPWSLETTPTSSIDSPGSCTSPDFGNLPIKNEPSTSGGGKIRRGRPRTEVINNLIIAGSVSPSAIKCTYCNRVFPREKSLMAHLRTHTGERPYACDYPGCLKAFTQSGQLRTHERLHTGEKPFVCGVPGCGARYTHANRRCNDHPRLPLVRSCTQSRSEKTYSDEKPHTSSHANNWCDTKPQIKSEADEEDGDERKPQPLATLSTNTVNRRILCENTRISNSNESISTNPIDTKYLVNDNRLKDYNKQQPKKRWLREAFQDPSLWCEDSGIETLAQPIRWDSDDIVEASPMNCKVEVDKENEAMATVPQRDDQILGALALMELANKNLASKLGGQRLN